MRAGQHRYPGEFNKRCRAGKRVVRLVKDLVAELGIDPTPVQRLAIERAATLQAISEDLMIRRVSGDTAITLDEVLRADHAARHALRAIGITKVRPAKRVTTLPALDEIIGS
jgi:hypothetical protein